MSKPNFIIMLVDNAGYGDLGCYGSTVHRTPNLDGMAAEGVRFTDFYSTSGVCTPSRASLLTGCYPRRVNMHDNGEGGCVLFPGAKKGLNTAEITIARLLRDAGYATGCFGKWHLGDQTCFLPTRHGFDHYMGVPYSEDMVPSDRRPYWPQIPLMRDEEVIEAPVDRTTLTRRYTEESVRFIEEHRDTPFFLYIPHAAPGSSREPLPGPEFAGKSANGLYGDTIEELDWSAGRILDTLRRLSLDENTFVVWASDNGAVRWDPPQGSNAPLAGWGYNTSEGGQRVPCIVRHAGTIDGGRECGAVTTMMDFYPTLARMAGVDCPSDRIIDGHDLEGRWERADDGDSPYDQAGFFYYMFGQLQAVRSGRWKLYLPLDEKIVSTSKATAPGSLALYDLRADISEQHELSAANPEVVKELARLAEKARNDMGDEGRQGKNQRPAGWVENTVYQTIGDQPWRSK